jgi:hypothetical protein
VNPLKTALWLVVVSAAFLSCQASHQADSLLNDDDYEKGNKSKWGDNHEQNNLTAAKGQPCLPPWRSGTLSGAPLGPDSEMTPGSLCEKPTEYRYPEHLKYCERDVSTGMKNDIMRRYDTRRSFNTLNISRGQIKIDHFIPLCMGGSNEITNLWPQHKSVGEHTDPIEPRLCLLIVRGQMKQAEAVTLIQEAKTDLTRASEICESLNQRLGL